MRSPAKTSTTKFHERALAGQVRDTMLDHMKTMNKVWAKLSEAEQQALIESTEKVAVDLVSETIDVITGAGTVSIKGAVKNVTVKEDVISGTVTIDRSDAEAALYMKAAHGTCQLSFATNRPALLNTGETPGADPDQPAMFGAGDRGAKAKSADMPETGDELAKARARRSSKAAPADDLEQID